MNPKKHERLSWLPVLAVLGGVVVAVTAEAAPAAACTPPPALRTTADAVNRTVHGPSARPSRLAVAARGGAYAAAAKDKRPPQTAPSRALDGLKNGLASGLASACARAALQPFDAVKTAQQASSASLSLLDAGRQLVARSGVGALYSGLLVAIFGSVPSIFLYFAVYQYAKQRLKDAWARDAQGRLSPRRTAASVAVAAALGNFCASWLRPPYEIIKQRLQAGIYPGPFAAIAAIYKERGLGGFWVGVVAQMSRDVPDAVVTLLLYELMHTAATERQHTHPFRNALIGAVAGGVGALVTNPMDVVKTRMMTSVELRRSFVAVVRRIYRTEGLSAFGKGALPRFLHKVPTNSLFFLCYETFRRLLRVRT